jgi:hypothetical protein
LEGQLLQSRSETIVISRINVTIHPHNSERYRELFYLARQGGFEGKYYGNRVGRIGQLAYEEERHLLLGSFFIYVNFNFDDVWYDMAKNDEADLGTIKSLQGSATLRPEFRRARFVFDQGNI